MKTELKNHIWTRFYGISCEGPVSMEPVLKKCLYQRFEQLPGNFFTFSSRYREILPHTIYIPNFRSIGTSKQILQRGRGGGGQNLPSPGHTNPQKARPVQTGGGGAFWRPRLTWLFQVRLRQNRRFSRVLAEYLKNGSPDFHQTYVTFKQSYIKAFEIKRLGIGYSLLPW